MWTRQKPETGMHTYTVHRALLMFISGCSGISIQRYIHGKEDYCIHELEEERLGVHRVRTPCPLCALPTVAQYVMK